MIDYCVLSLNSVLLPCPIFTGPPPAPIISTDSFTILGEENSTFSRFTILWNFSFTTMYAITSYVIIPLITTEKEDLTFNCPSSCSPYVPCQCSGLAMGERVTVKISAVNCDIQEGEAVAITIASCMLQWHK